MTYDPKLSHFAFPVSMMLPGGAIIHHFGTGFDALAIAAPFYFGGIAATVWMIGQGWLGYMADIETSRAANTSQVEEQGEDPQPEADGFRPMRKGWRVWGPTQKNKRKHQLEYNSVSMNLVQKDMRWQQWAQAICEGAPMSQSHWTGRGKTFSKPEYSERLNVWLGQGVLRSTNARGTNGGYKPNGAGGWRYIKSLAEGQEWIPLPHSNKV